VATADGNVIAVRGFDGTPLWSHRVLVGSGFPAGPALVDCNLDGGLDVVVANTSGDLFALAGKSGLEIWKAADGGPVTSPIFATELNGDARPEFFYLSGGDALEIRDAVTGRRSWRAQLGDSGHAAAPGLGDTDGDGLPEILIASRTGRIVALNARLRTILWEHRFPGEMFSSAPIVSDWNRDGRAEVLVGGPSGALYALDGQSGKLLARLDTGYPLLSALSAGDVDGDGGVEVVAVAAGKVIVVAGIVPGPSSWWESWQRVFGRPVWGRRWHGKR
jgi:outer membrane protein assembly factor BamB